MNKILFNINHVRVIPVPRPSVGHDDVLMVSVVVYDRLDGRPRVLYVVEITPQVAVFDDRRKVRLEMERNK